MIIMVGVSQYLLYLTSLLVTSKQFTACALVSHYTETFQVTIFCQKRHFYKGKIWSCFASCFAASLLNISTISCLTFLIKNKRYNAMDAMFVSVTVGVVKQNIARTTVPFTINNNCSGIRRLYVSGKTTAVKIPGTNNGTTNIQHVQCLGTVRKLE